MQNRQVKKQVYTEYKLILGIILSGIFCLGGILFIILVNGGLPAGIIFIGFAFVILAIMLFQPNFWIVFEGNEISIKTIFGKVKKLECWDDLYSVSIQSLQGGPISAEFFLLNFSNKEEVLISAKDAWETDHIIFFEYTPKREELLKRYTDVPIIDKRMSAK